MTNREWLESLSDEEFEMVLSNYACEPCDYCILEKYTCRGMTCKQAGLKWLQSEHKEDIKKEN